jgi:membrane protein DedA with SNARE-associated domain
MVHLHELDSLVREYGSWLVLAVVALQALGLPLPGTTALIAASLYAGTTHRLAIAGVIVAGASGALVGSSAGYALGRWGGERLLARLVRWPRLGAERLAVWRGLAAEHAGKLVFFGRWITGARNVAGLVSGASRMDLRRFLVLSASAAALWSAAAGLEYYYFGRALAAADGWLQVVLVVAALAWAGLSLVLLRRRALRRLRGQRPSA